MKKTLFAISTIAVLLGFTACTSENEILEPQVSGNTITIKASTEEATRTELGEGNDTEGYKVVWSEGDKIKLTFSDEYTFTLKSGAGTSTGEFEGKAPENDGKTYMAFYPASYDGKWTTEQTYVKNNIPQGVPMLATGISVQHGEEGKVTISPISFKNVGGILRLNLTGTAKVTSIKISATNLTNPITLNCGSTGVELNTTTATPFHIAVPGTDEGTAYSGLKIVITDDAGSVCTKTIKSDKSITVKRSQITTVNLSASNFVVPAYLCFTAEEAGATISMKMNGSDWTLPTLEYYSTDLSTWADFEIGTTKVTLTNVGDKVYFRAKEKLSSEKLPSFSTSDSKYVNFDIKDKKVAASGNVMSLIDPTCAKTTIPCNYCFINLFNGCEGLTSAPELPATTLANYCYQLMFKGCIGLKTAPALPATTVAEGSCYSMFSGCKGLETAPTTLPATTLAKNCYTYMFYNCTSLKTAPALPATTLAESCCYGMFNGCEGLTTAPELKATTLAKECYQSMFSKCYKLNSVTCLATDISASNCVMGWLNNITTTGTLYCAPGMEDSWTNNVPAGWTVVERSK